MIWPFRNKEQEEPAESHWTAEAVARIRQTVIDSHLHLYSLTAQRNRQLGGNAELEKLLGIMRNELQSLGIFAHTSQPGEPLAPALMHVSDFPSLPTTDPLLHNCVAQTVVPRFVWELQDDGQPMETTLCKEEVVLYRWSGKGSAPTGNPASQLKQLQEQNAQLRRRISELQKGSQQEQQGRQQAAAVAYLVLLQDNEVTGVIPVAEGTNVYGARPQAEEGATVHAVSLPQGELQPTHFAIVADSRRGTIKGQLRDGQWAVNNPSNHPEETELDNGDRIFISHTTFIFATP